MTPRVPRPRNGGPVPLARPEPPRLWTPEYGPVRVGPHGNQVSAGLSGGEIWVNVHTGTGVTAHLSIAQAEELYGALHNLIGTAIHDGATGRAG